MAKTLYHFATSPPAHFTTIATMLDRVIPARPRRIGLPWAVLALVALVAFLAANRNNLIPRQFDTVEPNKIYRSAALTPAALRRVVERYKIKTIIDLGAHEPNTPEEAFAQRTADALGLTRFSYDLEGDARGNPTVYLQALRLMNDPARQPVLVHCSSGAQRTGCLVGFQRMIHAGYTLDQAMAEADRFRDRPEKNPHLREILAKWAEPIRKALARGDAATLERTAPLPAPQPGVKIDAEGHIVAITK